MVELLDKYLASLLSRPSHYDHFGELSTSPRDNYHQLVTDCCGGTEQKLLTNEAAIKVLFFFFFFNINL